MDPDPRDIWSDKLFHVRTMLISVFIVTSPHKIRYIHLHLSFGCSHATSDITYMKAVCLEQCELSINNV